MTAITSPDRRGTHAGGTVSLLRTGLPVVALGGVATTALAAAAQAVGVSLDMAGAPIPVLGFGVLTVVFGLVGVLLALALSRWARQPRRTFVITTVILTVLSLVPDALADVAGSTRALLMTSHLVAASIIVPALARRLPRSAARASSASPAEAHSRAPEGSEGADPSDRRAATSTVRADHRDAR